MAKGMGYNNTLSCREKLSTICKHVLVTIVAISIAYKTGQ